MKARHLQHGGLGSKTNNPKTGTNFGTLSIYKLSKHYITDYLEAAVNGYDIWVANNAKPKAKQNKQSEIGVELKLHKSYKETYLTLKQYRAVVRNLVGA